MQVGTDVDCEGDEGAEFSARDLYHALYSYFYNIHCLNTVLYPCSRPYLDRSTYSITTTSVRPTFTTDQTTTTTTTTTTTAPELPPPPRYCCG